MVRPPHGSIVAKGKMIHKKKGGAIVASRSLNVLKTS